MQPCTSREESPLFWQDRPVKAVQPCTLREVSCSFPSQLRPVKAVQPCTSRAASLLSSQRRSFKAVSPPCTLSPVSLLLPHESPVIFPVSFTLVPFACRSVAVPLLSSVSVHPSTVTGVPSSVVTVTLMPSVSELRVSSAVHDLTPSSVPPLLLSLGPLHAVMPNSASAKANVKNVFIMCFIKQPPSC